MKLKVVRVAILAAIFGLALFFHVPLVAIFAAALGALAGRVMSPRPITTWDERETDRNVLLATMLVASIFVIMFSVAFGALGIGLLFSGGLLAGAILGYVLLRS